MAVVSSERKALRIVEILKEANKWQAANRMGVSPDMVTDTLALILKRQKGDR